MEKKRLAISLQEDTIKALSDYAVRQGLQKSQLVELVLKEFFKKEETKAVAGI